MIATLKHTRATQKYEDYIFFCVSNFNISISTTCSPVRHSPQLSSSLPSEQSAELSHLQLWLMHFPSPHWNWDPGQPEEVCGCGRAEPHIFLVSSRPSLQSVCPSHSVCPGRQASDGPQEKKPAVQFRQEASSLLSLQSSTPLQRKRVGMQCLLLLQENSSFLHNSLPARSHSFNKQ